MSGRSVGLLLCILAGCETSLGSRADTGAPLDAPGLDAATPSADAFVDPSLDAFALPGMDAFVDPGADAFVDPDPDAFTPLPPAAARPPAPPPDLSSIIFALAAERPGDLEGSCVMTGGTHAFLFEAVRRMRAVDPRWGLDREGTGIVGDHVTYYWGDGAPEGSTEVYVLDVIARLCARPGIDAPAAPSWLDVTSEGGVWTIMGLDDPIVPVDAGMVMTDAGAPMMPLPDGRPVVNALAAERPDLLAASCVEMGGNNDFLFELVRRLRAMDVRWGLNWKRGVVGDMSQDVVDYYFGPGDPVESSTDVYILDVIGGHCGPTPSPAFTDVTEATRMGGTIGRWTLAGRSDLGP